MGRKSRYLPLLFLSFLFAAILGEAYGRVGGWSTIPDLKDPHVLEIANFAVSQHNKEAKPTLSLVELIGGEQQVVAGMNYRLVLYAKESGSGRASKPRKYEAVVYERAWENFRELTSFTNAKG